MKTTTANSTLASATLWPTAKPRNVSSYIMKTTAIIFTLTILVLTSCSNRQEKTESSSSTNLVDTLPIDFIRQVSLDRKYHYNMDSLDLSKLKLIDTTFFKKWFDNVSVNNDDFKIQFDNYSRYYFFDFKDQDTKFLFSIIHDDEVGYYNLFHFTFDKTKQKIVQADYVSQTGGDGGHGNVDLLNYNKTGDILYLTSISTFDEDFDKGYTRQYDSTITKIEFNLPTTKYLKTDSLSRLDTIWDKK
jgi:hypothetical protein